MVTPPVSSRPAVARRVNASPRRRRPARAALYVLAAAYLAGIFVYGVGCTSQYRFVPGDVSNLLEVAALFPYASREVTEYRIEGYACADRRWDEVDYRAYFALHAEDKENLFQRAVSLYRNDPGAMADLDDYVVDHHNARAHADGTATGQPIGGVRFVRVGMSIPKPGAALQPFKHKRLAEYPKSRRHVVYATPAADIDARCGEHEAPNEARAEVARAAAPGIIHAL